MSCSILEHAKIKNLKEKNMKELTEFFDLPIVFHRSFVSFGGVTGALLLSQMCYWSKRTQHPEQWFWKTQEQWEEETGLTRKEQETARKRLVSCGAISEKKEGIPCKTWFKVNYERIFELIKSNKLVCTNRADCDVQIVQTVMPDSGIHTITEITTENTTDNIFMHDASNHAKNRPISNMADSNIKNNADSEQFKAPKRRQKAKDDQSHQEVDLISKNMLKTPKSEKGSRIDPDLKLTDDYLDSAIAIVDKYGLSLKNSEIEMIFDSFKDYWMAKDKDAKKICWLATWRNWVRNSVERKIEKDKPKVFRRETIEEQNERSMREYLLKQDKEKNSPEFFLDGINLI